MNKGAFVVALVCLLLSSPFVRKGPREAEYLSYSQQALAGAPLPLRGGGDQGGRDNPQRKTSREGTLSLRPAKIRQRRGAIRLILAHLSEITVQSGQFLSA